MIPAYGASFDDVLLYTDNMEFILKHLKGLQSWEYHPNRSMLNIQLCGYKMHDLTQYDNKLPILDSENPVTETAKKRSVKPGKEYTPRIEHCRWKAGKMFGSEGWRLTKQVYTVSIHKLNSSSDY